jgi:hypothetical protein
MPGAGLWLRQGLGEAPVAVQGATVTLAPLLTLGVAPPPPPPPPPLADGSDGVQAKAAAGPGGSEPTGPAVARPAAAEQGALRPGALEAAYWRYIRPDLQQVGQLALY